MRAGVQPEQPECSGGVGVQVLVGPGEHGAYRGARVTAGLQQVQPLLLIGELPCEVGEGDVRTGGGEFGCHSQGKRQPCALGRQVGGSDGVGASSTADQVPQ